MSVGSLDCTTVVSLALLPSPREEALHRLGTREVGRPDSIPVAGCIPSSEDYWFMAWRGKYKVASNTNKALDGIRDVLTNQLGLAYVLLSSFREFSSQQYW